MEEREPTARRTWHLSRKHLWLPVVLAVVLLALLLRGTERDLAYQSDALGDLLEPGAARGFNLLLVSLDTTRQDRLGCYGYELAQTPVIDGLCRHGLRYEHAVATTPVTLPSHATLLTGQYPPSNGVRDNGLYVLADEHTTLAERLREAGYATGAFVGCFVLDARFGLDQGFDRYDFRVTQEGQRRAMPDFNERPADAVTSAAVEWLREIHGEDGRSQAGHTGSAPAGGVAGGDVAGGGPAGGVAGGDATSGGPAGGGASSTDPSQSGRPFFLFVHYFDPHLPYTSPLEGREAFAGRPYDAEIAWVDEQLGRLLGELRRLGQAEKTLVILVADHGESLGDHGEETHGLFLYESTVRVPLIISSEGLFDREYVDRKQLAGLVDVRSTAEDLLGLGPAETDGVSLLRTKPDPERTVYLETYAPLHQWGFSPLYGLRTVDEKYVLAPTPEYYDLQRDPPELRNRYAADPSHASILEEQLTARMSAWDIDEATVRQMSDEEIERLSSLGYVQSAAPAPTGGRADPKEMIATVQRSGQAEKLYAARRYAEAAELARQVYRECPYSLQATRVLAFSLLRGGASEEAITILTESVGRNPDTFLIRSLAQALIAEGQIPEAEEVLQLYATTDPSDGRVHLLRGDIHRRAGRLEGAAAEYRRAIELDPQRTGPAARERLGRIGL